MTDVGILGGVLRFAQGRLLYEAYEWMLEFMSFTQSHQIMPSPAEREELARSGGGGPTLYCEATDICPLDRRRLGFQPRLQSTDHEPLPSSKLHKKREK